MFCPSCQNSKIKAITPKTIELTGNNKLHCKQCGFPVNNTNTFYGCTNCKNYYLCVNCKVCPKSHLLNKVYNLTICGSGSYKDNYFWCDVCSKETKTFNWVWHCKPCQYDICETCIKNC